MSISEDTGKDMCLAVAAAWTEAVRLGNRADIERLISHDCAVWRNVTRAVQPRADFVELAVGLSELLPGFRYEDVTRMAFDGGFIQQHVIKGQGPSGRSFEAPACIICWVRHDAIYKLDEYYDSAHDPR